MIRIEILAIGRVKKGAYYDLFKDYSEKLRWGFTLREFDSPYKDPKTVKTDENQRLLSAIDPSAFVVALDERGNGVKSLDFAKTIENLQDNGEQLIQFVIGGADGLSDDMRDRANMLLSFGQQTWPHKMVRVMLIEQIYRAQQIMAGHPYHRE